MNPRKPSAKALLFGVSSIALAASGMLAPAKAQSTIVLDAINVLATKTPEKTSDSLAAISSVRTEQLDKIMPGRVSDALIGMPGVWMSERGDDPATALNIRGMQDFGRVNVVVDGARQNFQRSGHNANGMFYLDPELISGIDVIRGPVANIYGSGAIGGVASFQTKDVDDVLKPGERYGVLLNAMGGSFSQGLGSAFLAARGSSADVFAGIVGRTTGKFTTGEHGTAIANQPGDGVSVRNSASDSRSGIAKFTVRPADGHEIKVGGIVYDSWYKTPWTLSSTSTIYDTHVTNNTVTARWKYSRPDDRIFDYNINGYWNETNTNQRTIQSSSAASLGNVREFNIDTKGVDAHNTSRFDIGEVRHALTVGGDFFRDDVLVTDPAGTADLFTPSGERTVWGGFGQLKSNYSTWLEVITALRYDNYKLSGGNTSTAGDRLSPKATVGITPVQWFTVYGTYAEGYRAPAVTETLVTNAHPSFGPFPLYSCPDGSSGLFCFLPNPNLRPEVGKTKEVGFNIRHDDLLTRGDKLRIKANLFRNDVDDFIESVSFGPVTMLPGYGPVYQFLQYQNIATAKIEGVEFEGTYDAGNWFLGLAAHRIRGTNVETDEPLRTIPPDMIATTVGARFFDRKLTTMLRWQSVAAKDASDVPAGATPRASYELLNFYLGFQPHPDVTAGLAIDNLLDNYYIRYLDNLPAPGRAFKASLKVRLSDKTLNGG